MRALTLRFGIAVAMAVQCAFAVGGETRLDAFAFKASSVPTNTVLVYEKTNIGFPERVALITLFVDKRGNLQALKHLRNEPHPLLVEADFDTSLFSVTEFRAWQLPRKPDQLSDRIGTLDRHNGQFVVTFPGVTKRVNVSSFPWHLHDFELMSLGYAMRFLKSVKTTFTFDLVGLSDDLKEPVPYKDSGDVTVTYETTVACGPGRNCAEYALLWSPSGRYFGRLQLDEANRDMVLVETVGPDEPGLISMRMRLVKRSLMSPAEWKATLANASVQSPQ